MIRILIVDDERWNVAALIDVVENAIDCEVVSAYNCSEAIHLFNEQNFNYVIVDLVIPAGEMDLLLDDKQRDIFGYGIGLVRNLVNKRNDSKIIIYSIRAKELGAMFGNEGVYYISKYDALSMEKIINILRSK